MDQKTLELLLEKILKRVLANHPTNDDLVAMEKRLKNELKATEERLNKEIQQVEIAVTVNANKNKADKNDLLALEKRVTALEHN